MYPENSRYYLTVILNHKIKEGQFSLSSLALLLQLTQTQHPYLTNDDTPHTVVKRKAQETHPATLSINKH